MKKLLTFTVLYLGFSNSVFAICSDIEKLRDSVYNGFPNNRGSLVYGSTFASLYILPNADECDIDFYSDDGASSYQCTWRDYSKSDAESIAKSLSSCNLISRRIEVSTHKDATYWESYLNDDIRVEVIYFDSFESVHFSIYYVPD